MRAAAVMTIGAILFIYLRAIRTDIPVFSLLWWAWIIMTVAVSAATGSLWTFVWLRRKGTLK